MSEGRAKQESRYQAHPKQGAGQGTSYHHYAANSSAGFKSGHIEVGMCLTWHQGDFSVWELIIVIGVKKICYKIWQKMQ